MARDDQHGQAFCCGSYFRSCSSGSLMKEMIIRFLALALLMMIIALATFTIATYFL
jgi:hypothetical protein